MKIAATVAATLIMASSAVSAMDLTVAGQTLSAGGKADLNYDTGTELWAMEFVPSVGMNAWGTDFKASTTFSPSKAVEYNSHLFGNSGLRLKYNSQRLHNIL